MNKSSVAGTVSQCPCQKMGHPKDRALLNFCDHFFVQNNIP